MAAPTRVLDLQILSPEQERILNSSGVTFGPVERATKFTYDANTGKWHLDPARYKIAEKFYAEGGMRRAYRACELLPDGSLLSGVIKLFKDEKMKPSVIFHEALTQAVASKYAERFNELTKRKNVNLKVTFLPVTVVRLNRFNSIGEELYATIEPFLPGQYIKLSDNSGRHLDDAAADAAQTFSHYTFLASNKQLVCVDIQGVIALSGNPLAGAGIEARELTLTDPQIHSVDGNLFGSGNLGFNGIASFVQSYKRTKLDEKLGFGPLTPASLLQVKAVERNFKETEDSGVIPFDTEELAKRIEEDEEEREAADRFAAAPEQLGNLQISDNNKKKSPTLDLAPPGGTTPSGNAQKLHPPQQQQQQPVRMITAIPSLNMTNSVRFFSTNRILMHFFVRGRHARLLRFLNSLHRSQPGRQGKPCDPSKWRNLAKMVTYRECLWLRSRTRLPFLMRNCKKL